MYYTRFDPFTRDFQRLARNAFGQASAPALDVVRHEGDVTLKLDVPGIDPEQLDRKSTRLNSSHSQISYAVFCLKKKTTTIPTANSKRRQNCSLTTRLSASTGIFVFDTRVPRSTSTSIARCLILTSAAYPDVDSV